MIINGQENSALHITKDEKLNKYMVLAVKQVSESIHKSAKVMVDEVHIFDNSHSIEISGAHYAVVKDMDFYPMVSRISKSRSYRKYKNRVELAA